jgi:type II secretory pathway predicted ATPase ExeA/phage tail protein X
VYTEFFGLKLKPFSIAPDPRFLYMSHTHKEALAHLVYGVKEKSGFVVITGEAGTGKTTLLNALLNGLPSDMPKVVIKNPNITQENIYYLIGEAIGIPEEIRNRNHIKEFEERLRQIGGAALIVDEAQGLSIAMLEEIRLLSNLETPERKLVHILLLGQQELNTVLKSPMLRQMKQRISVKFHLEPLNYEETKDYINHRLRVAGYEPKETPIFPLRSIKEIYSLTKGFPRLINTLCDNALLAGFIEDRKEISTSIIRKVFREIEASYGKEEIPLKKNRFVFALVAIALVILASASLFLKYVIPGYMPRETKNHIAAEDSSKKTVELEGDVLSQASGVPASAFETGEPFKRVIKVKPGTYLSAIASDYYGKSTPGIINAIKLANPRLNETDGVDKNVTVVLPPLETIKSQYYTVCIASYNTGAEARLVSDSMSAKGIASGVFQYIDEKKKRWFLVNTGVFQTKEEAEIKAGDLIGQGFLYSKPVKINLEG